MMRFSKKKDWTEDERRIVDLLLQGDSEFLDCLRRQMSPPFLLEIERRSPNTRPKFRRTPPNEYAIDIIYDGSLEEEFSAGYGISLNIDDLKISEARLKRELTVVGSVNNGVLTNIHFISEGPVKWPKYIQLEDWSFWSEGKSARKRPSFEKLDIPVRRIQVSDMKDSWVKELLVQANQQGVQVGVRPPAEAAAISALEREIAAELPVDFREFLNATNGARVSGSEIFSCDRVYLLDADDLSSDHLLVFATTKFGNPVALDLSQVRKDTGLCPVVFLDHDTGEAVILSESFREWLTRFVEVALEGEIV